MLDPIQSLIEVIIAVRANPDLLREQRVAFYRTPRSTDSEIVFRYGGIGMFLSGDSNCGYEKFCEIHPEARNFTYRIVGEDSDRS